MFFEFEILKVFLSFCDCFHQQTQNFLKEIDFSKDELLYLIDFAILDELKKNGRQSASEISKKVSLSIPAVAERIRKLEKAEIIQQYTIKINRDKIGKRLLSFIFVNIERTENIERERQKKAKFSDGL